MLLKMFKSILLLLSIIYCCTLVLAQKAKPIPAQGFSLASNRFGLDLLNQIYVQQQQQQQKPEQQPENVFFSPYSIAVALSMVHQASNGQTQHQLRHALHYDEEDVKLIASGQQQQQQQQQQQSSSSSSEQTKQTIATSIKEISERLQQQQQQQQGDQNNQFVTGNIMVIDKDIHVKEDYQRHVQQYYEGVLFKADFKQDAKAIQQRINQYVSNRTFGLIDTMLSEPPTTDTRLALVNAVYFKGQWAIKFEPEQTETGVFYGHNGQQYQNVQFMKAKTSFPHADLVDLDADLVMIPYYGEEVSFVGVLPRKRDADLSQIRTKINATYIDQMIMQTNAWRSSTVYLPKVNITTSYDLPKYLKALGITDVFNSQSDLSGISSDGTKLAIGQVLHKAKLIINEQGTEAGAGTYVGIMALSLPTNEPIYRFDHPFIYFIRHQSTGQILFIGEVHRF